MNVWCKAYPLSGAKQRAVDAAISAYRSGVRAEAVRKVTVRMPPWALQYPGADWRGPFSRFTQAQNSTQFCVAAGMLGRNMQAVETFTRGFGDADIGEFMQKIELVADESRSASGAERLDVELLDGEIRSFEVEWTDGRVGSIAKMTDKLRLLTKGSGPSAPSTISWRSSPVRWIRPSPNSARSFAGEADGDAGGRPAAANS